MNRDRESWRVFTTGFFGTWNQPLDTCHVFIVNHWMWWWKNSKWFAGLAGLIWFPWTTLNGGPEQAGSEKNRESWWIPLSTQYWLHTKVQYSLKKGSMIWQVWHAAECLVFKPEQLLSSSPSRKKSSLFREKERWMVPSSNGMAWVLFDTPLYLSAEPEM